MSEILLVGPPNAGKTTLFNALTSSREITGNFHGVTATVARAEYSYEGESFFVSDLPGIYGLSPYSLEEKASVLRLREGGECIVCVIEALYPLAGLRLLKELKPLNMPIIVAVTKNKMHKRRGGSFDFERLATLCGLSVIEVDSGDKKSLNELKEAIFQGGKKNFLILIAMPF